MNSADLNLPKLHVEEQLEPKHVEYNLVPREATTDPKLIEINRLRI